MSVRAKGDILIIGTALCFSALVAPTIARATRPRLTGTPKAACAVSRGPETSGPAAAQSGLGCSGTSGFGLWVNDRSWRKTDAERNRTNFAVHQFWTFTAFVGRGGAVCCE